MKTKKNLSMKTKKNLMKPMLGVGVLVLDVLLPNAVQADINTWNQLSSGNASGSWATAANPPWSSGALPGSTDTASFNTLDITADSTITLDGNQSINALIFGDTTTSSAAGWLLSAGTPSTSLLTLGGTTPTITVNTLGTAKAATISAFVAGTAGLIKAGAGMLVLSNTNTYSGGTTVNGGRLSLQDISKNTLSGAVSIGSGAILGADTSSGNNSHLLSGNLILTGGTLAGNGNVSDTANGQFYINTFRSVLVSGDVQSTISAEMHVGFTSTFDVADGAAAEDLLVTGKLSHLHGALWGTIAKTGAGTMHLASSMDGTNSAGQVGIFGLAGFELNAGTLIFDGSLGYSAFGPGDKGARYLADFTGPATLKWGVGNTMDISVNGNMRIGAGVTATLDTGTNAVTLGTAIAVGGAGAALTKTGTGTLVLSGTNTYSGGTTVNGGMLCVNGTLASTPVTVVSNAVFSAGALDGIGQAGLGGTMIFENGARLVVDLQGGAADTISVSGNVTIGSNVQLQVSGDQARVGNWKVLESTGGSLSGDFVLVGATNGVTLTKAGSAVWLRIPPKGTLIRVY